MQTISASPGSRIVKRNLQIVVAKEPVEGRPGFAAPMAISGYTVCLQTCRNRASGFKGLLIETGPFTILATEALRSNRHKVAVVFAMLHLQQPIQCFETSGKHPFIRAS